MKRNRNELMKLLHVEGENGPEAYRCFAQLQKTALSSYRKEKEKEQKQTHHRQLGGED